MSDKIKMVSAIIIILMVVLPGCTSMLPINGANTHQEILENINPGDLIHVETFDGSKHEILVESISLEAVKGEEIEIPLDQIKTIEKKQISALKTTGVLIGLYYLFAAIASVALITAL